MNFRFHGVILAWTNAAILFQSHWWHHPMWLPKSQVYISHDDGTSWEVNVRAWLANKNNLDEFSEVTEEWPEYG